MRTSSAIAAIGATFGSKFIAHEMLAAGSTMTTPAKYFYLIYKIGLVHNGKGTIIKKEMSGFDFIQNSTEIECFLTNGIKQTMTG